MGAELVSDTRLTLRVDFGARRSIGPGKIRLLEEIDRTGSISEAGRKLGMSYRRAWLLIDDMNRCFNHTVVSAKPGGSQGGGTTLTKFGAGLIRQYRAIEAAALRAAKSHLGSLETALRDTKKPPPKKPQRTSIRGMMQAH
ncbi:MAG TPA: LysR family transcriptional regulator [Xanthobacteraceae bacterium]|jgi:molybdate transport system regulatory protein|nr:LysR family transcriptional regulator [Xanthobacteraceae bacterium]